MHAESRTVLPVSQPTSTQLRMPASVDFSSSVTYHVIKDCISARVNQSLLHGDMSTFITTLADTFFMGQQQRHGAVSLNDATLAELHQLVDSSVEVWRRMSVSSRLRF